MLYESERATVYQGDCRDVIPTLGPNTADLIVTDPPYGVNARSSSMRKLQEKFSPIVGDDDKGKIIETLSECVKPLRKNRHLYVFGIIDRVKEAENIRDQIDKL